jgi:GntR family transcriptional regulator
MFKQLDPMSDRPVYQQIADSLRGAILSKQLIPGSPLPSESDLMRHFGAARGTIRQAIGVLKGEGLVIVEQGRGTFVPVQAPVRRLSHDRFLRQHRKAGRAAFIVEIEAQGFAPRVDVLSVEPQPASSDIAQRLGLRKGAKVLMRKRLYFANDWPLELATSYLPWAIAKGTPIVEIDPGPGGIYARLEERGFGLKRFIEEVATRMPSAEEARALKLRAGVPVISLVRTAYGEEDRALEVCDTVMAGDRYVLSYELPAN